MSTFSSLKSRARHGFTLIELLLVIGIIAILASIVIVAINPTKQLGDARNAQRRSDVNSILNAVYQYAIDNNGTLPATIPTDTTGSTDPYEICEGTVTALACAALTNKVNLKMLTGSYLVAIPEDPQDSVANLTNYYIEQDTNGRITVSAPGTEQLEAGEAAISVTR